MILTCPSCDKRYRVDSSKIGPSGRSVRCVVCKHVWQQEDGTTQEAVLVQETKESAEKISKEPVFKRFTIIQKSFFALIGAFLFATLFFSMRHTLVALVPQLTPVYQLLNISTLSSDDLDFEGVHIAPVKGASEKDLVIISGSAINKSDRLIHAPTLWAHALGDCKKTTWTKRLSAWVKSHKKCSLYSWPLTLKDNTLFPGEEIEFSSFPLLTPQNIYHFEIRFD